MPLCYLVKQLLLYEHCFRLKTHAAEREKLRSRRGLLGLIDAPC